MKKGIVEAFVFYGINCRSIEKKMVEKFQAVMNNLLGLKDELKKKTR